MGNYIQEKWRAFTQIENEKLLKLVKSLGRRFGCNGFISIPTSRIRSTHCITYHFPFTPSKYNQDWSKIVDEFPDRSFSDIRKHYKCNPSMNPNVKLGKWDDNKRELFKKALEVRGKDGSKSLKLLAQEHHYNAINFINA